MNEALAVRCGTGSHVSGIPNSVTEVLSVVGPGAYSPQCGLTDVVLCSRHFTPFEAPFP